MRALLDETTDAARPARATDYAALQQRHRVRPKPGFVVRAVVWSRCGSSPHRARRPRCCRGRCSIAVGADDRVLRPGVDRRRRSSSATRSRRRRRRTTRCRRAGRRLRRWPRSSARPGSGSPALVASRHALPCWGVVLAAARRDRVDRAVRVPRRDPDQPAQGLDPRGAARRARPTGSSRSPRRRPASASTPPSIWLVTLRRHRGARLHRRLVVGAAGLRRRLRRHDAAARAHALHPRQEVLNVGRRRPPDPSATVRRKGCFAMPSRRRHRRPRPGQGLSGSRPQTRCARARWSRLRGSPPAACSDCSARTARASPRPPRSSRPCRARRAAPLSWPDTMSRPVPVQGARHRRRRMGRARIHRPGRGPLDLGHLQSRPPATS